MAGIDILRISWEQLASKARNGMILKILSPRGLFTQGVHDRNRRYGSIGIALIGAFTSDLDENPTQAQLDSLVWLVDDLQNRFSGIENIVPHHEECPGVWFVEFRRRQGWN